jgi:DNA-binding Lrp family transcriptional regulator
MKRKRIPPADFVAAWQTAENLIELSAELGLSQGALRARASRLRKRGVALKTMPRANEINAKALSSDGMLIGAWQSSASVEEAANKLGATPRATLRRARTLMRKGVRLKRLKCSSKS